MLGYSLNTPWCIHRNNTRSSAAQAPYYILISYYNSSTIPKISAAINNPPATNKLPAIKRIPATIRMLDLIRDMRKCLSDVSFGSILSKANAVKSDVEK